MNVDELLTYLLSPAAQVALIIGVAEIVKRAGLPSRWIPLVDIFLGLISGVCVFGLLMEYGIGKGIILGVAVGLCACGLFSGIKNVTRGGNDNDRSGN